MLRNEKADPAAEHALTLAYLIFAYSFWPVICPLSVYAIEYSPNRKKALRILIGLGLITGIYLLFFILKNPVDALVLNCSIRYETHLAGPHWFTGVYLMATILPYFISSHRSILVFGIPNFILCLAAYVFYNSAFISVWCFFAAITSLSLYLFLRRLHHQPLIGFFKK